MYLSSSLVATYVSVKNAANPLTRRQPAGLIAPLFCFPRSIHGQVAQLVEQRTENPRVGGSIPPLATNL